MYYIHGDTISGSLPNVPKFRKLPISERQDKEPFGTNFLFFCALFRFLSTALLPGHSVCQASALRKSFGDAPVAVLKLLEKWATSRKPILSAMS